MPANSDGEPIPKTITIPLNELAKNELDYYKSRADAVFNEDENTLTVPNPELEISEQAEAKLDEAAVADEDVPPVPDAVRAKLEKAYEKHGTGGKGESRGAATNEPKGPVEPEVTEADRREFVRCLLGDSLFTKTYTLMGGDLRIILSERSAEQEEDAIYRMAKIDTIRRPLECQYAKLAYSLRSLAAGDNVRKFTEINPGDTIKSDDITVPALEHRIGELKKMKYALFAALLKKLEEFNALVGKLYEDANDPKS